MNDFTKEELIILKDALYGVLLDVSEEKILANTLQSMIDNYCEHEPSKNHPPIPWDAEGSYIKEWEYRCGKCLRIYYDNQ